MNPNGIFVYWDESSVEVRVRATTAVKLGLKAGQVVDRKTFSDIVRSHLAESEEQLRAHANGPN